jgi:hypothetical protein
VLHRSPPPDDSLSDAPGVLALGCVLATRQGDSESEADVADLVHQATALVGPWVAQRGLRLAGLRRHSGEYRGLVESWAARHSRHPWEAPLGERPQTWVNRRVGAPLEESFACPTGYVGNGYLRPARGGIWTTTSIEGWPRDWFLGLVFGTSASTDRRVWRMRITPEARIYEIRTPDDFAELVESYPVLREAAPRQLTPDWALPGPLYLPDWQQASQHWDGIRFAMLGKLRTLTLSLPVLNGYTTLLDDLGCEETLWLNWVFDDIRETGAMGSKGR